MGFLKARKSVFSTAAVTGMKTFERWCSLKFFQQAHLLCHRSVVTIYLLVNRHTHVEILFFLRDTTHGDWWNTSNKGKDNVVEALLYSHHFLTTLFFGIIYSAYFNGEICIVMVSRITIFLDCNWLIERIGSYTGPREIFMFDDYVAQGVCTSTERGKWRHRGGKSSMDWLNQVSLETEKKSWKNII